MTTKRSNELTERSLAAAHLRERHEVRYRVRIEIEVSGIHRNCDSFHELTFTEDVSACGCSFLLPLELRPNDIFSVRVVGSDQHEDEPERQSLFQALRVQREGEGWLIAAWSLEAGDLWSAELNKAAPEMGRRELRKQGS